MKDERGVIGGADAILFGALCFFAGTIIILNAWSVIDTKFAADSAAREAGRAYVEAPSQTDAVIRAIAASDRVATNENKTYGDQRITISGGFIRCADINFDVEFVAPRSRVPFIGTLILPMNVHGHYSEVVDPYRASQATSPTTGDPCA